MTVIYAYNPFSGDTLDRVLRRIRESYEARPRRLVIVWRHPIHLDRLLSKHDWLQRKERLEGLSPGSSHAYGIYAPHAEQPLRTEPGEVP